MAQVLGHSENMWTMVTQILVSPTSKPMFFPAVTHWSSCFWTVPPHTASPTSLTRPGLPERLSGRPVPPVNHLGADLCLLACYCIRPFMAIQQLVTDYEGSISEVFC